MSTPERSGQASIIEPEEPMLEKYSKQHEFSLSTMISIGTHVLVALIAFAAGAAFFSWNTTRELPEVANLGIEGGGGREGQRGADEESLPLPEIIVPADSASAIPPVPSPTLEPQGRPVSPTQLREQEDKTRVKSGTSGKSGGEGGIDGPDKGRFSGRTTGTNPPEAVDPVRAWRMDRWSISMTYGSGEEYLQKLANLGAKIAIPQDQETLALYSDLEKRPIPSASKSRRALNQMGWIYWANDDSTAIQALTSAMGLSVPPRRLYVFFPRDLEQEMLRKELAHSRLTEKQLKEKDLVTTFRAERKDGKWVVTVIEHGRRYKEKGS